MKHVQMGCLVALLASLFFAFSCGGAGDARKIAAALANALTDALDLDSSSDQSGLPPDSSTDASAPAISSVTGTKLRFGAPLAFTIRSNYTGTDVDHAVVFVDGATKYIQVNGGLVRGVFTLSGLLEDNESLRGHSFTLKFALATRTGVVGAYSKLVVNVLDMEAQTTGKSIKAVTADGESSYDSGRPDASNDPAAPQITSLSGPAELVAGGSFTLDLSTDYNGLSRKSANRAITGVILTTPGNIAYKQVPATLSGGVVTVDGALASDLTVGDELVFLLALKAGDVVGAYRSWAVTVTTAVDGDQDADTTENADGDSEADTMDSDADTVDRDSEADTADGDVDTVDSDSEADTADGDVDTVDGDSEADTTDADTVVALEFVLIPAGSFTMGSPTDELGRETDETLHQVTLTYAFEMSKYEMTQDQFSELMHYNPSAYTSCGGNCPVEQVSWHEACAAANALSVLDGYSECYDCTGNGTSVNCSMKAAYAKPQDCPGFRLPTEAEWEYAARAGTTTAFYNGVILHGAADCGDDSNLDLIGWYCGNSNNTTHPVGLKTPNAWGLYDMSGNVFEWGWDWWDGSDYGSGSVTDPTGQSTGSLRINRGGDWRSYARYSRAAYRNNGAPGNRSSLLGFRLVRSTSSTPADGDMDSDLDTDTTDSETSYYGDIGSDYCLTSQCFLVPPTGQTKCHDNASEIACPGTAGTSDCGSTAFCGQDAQYTHNIRTYTCYSAFGVVMACDSTIEASSDEVVVDSLTSLMWQRTYVSYLVWQDALDYCSNLVYAGHSDWRLPNPFELQSIVDYEKCLPSIDTTAFPGTPVDYFWSSSSFADGTLYAWHVDFFYGDISFAGGKANLDGSARCVRG